MKKRKKAAASDPTYPKLTGIAGGGSVRLNLFQPLPSRYKIQLLIDFQRLVCSETVPHIPIINGGRYGGRESGNRTQGTK